MSDFQALETQVHAVTQAVRDAADRVNAEIAALVSKNPDLGPDIAELQAAVADLNHIGQGNVPGEVPAPAVGPDGVPGGTTGGDVGATGGTGTDVTGTDAGVGTSP